MIYLNMWQNFTINASNLAPYLLVAPQYFTGAMTFGVVMRIGRAFFTVQESLNILALNFEDFAAWKATTNRLVEFFKVMDQVDHERENKSHGDLKIQFKDVEKISVKDLSVSTPQDKVLLDGIKFDVKIGEKLLIVGKSGIGKTTVFRALSGIWPYAGGSVTFPQEKKIFYLSQKPYMPVGTLKDCLSYPSHSDSKKINMKDLKEYLKVFRLEKLEKRLDEVQDWGVALSLGEQQRVAFIRVLLAKPDILCSDEPSASLDTVDESLFFEMLIKKLPEITLITIGHGDSLTEHHTKKIDLKKFMPERV
jgi:putative ATP-binding cassette transporter